MSSQNGPTHQTEPDDDHGRAERTNPLDTDNVQGSVLQGPQRGPVAHPEKSDEA